uniref:Calcium channel YVC1-like C-terminal transmembrane domain-containing protein n=1 Tax=Bionectria ochroleuca TaxID=29856 RepID=A0A8H7MYM1_BIOOC
MPIRVKSKVPSGAQEREFSPGPVVRMDWELPNVGQDDAFQTVVENLSNFFSDAIDLPSSFEQLRTAESLKILVEHLSRTCTNPAIVNALLALRWHYSCDTEHSGLSEARSNACEIVAWRFLTRLSERDAVDYCLHEIPGNEALEANPGSSLGLFEDDPSEQSPLLPHRRPFSAGTSGLGLSTRRFELQRAVPKITFSSNESVESGGSRSGVVDSAKTFKSLNALEIAGIAGAKRFLSQNIVQKIITSIWDGEIVFWDTISGNSVMKPRYYNPRTADPYSRLRVPKYLKTWEILFFIAFLCLYYSVVLKREMDSIPFVEVVFYIWLASFLLDEIQQWADAGLFYLSDLWNIFDIGMITLGIVFAILRVVGISTSRSNISELAFDILSLEALLVMPRIFSFLSLNPYWGTLIPCIRAMAKDFVKFIILVIIVYMGFLTTFSLIGRDSFTLPHITWSLAKIFYGNTGIAFEIMDDVDPTFGPPLMILFITLSSILLTGSLTGMLSNSFSRVMTHAREEYLYIYSVYVLEASTSSRLTHFYPPLNLISLVFFHPWHVVFSGDDKFRHSRVVALKITHFPFVAVIYAYEWFWRKACDSKDHEEWARYSGGRSRSDSEAPGTRPTIGQPRTSGSPYRAASGTYRSLNRYLDTRSRSRSIGSNERIREEDEGPSNADLMKQIQKLTEMVVELQKKQSQNAEEAKSHPHHHLD